MAFKWEPELNRWVDANTGATVIWFELIGTVEPNQKYKASFDIREDSSRFMIVLDERRGELSERTQVGQGLISVEFGVQFEGEPASEFMRSDRWFLAGQMYYQWRRMREQLRLQRPSV